MSDIEKIMQFFPYHDAEVEGVHADVVSINEQEDETVVLVEWYKDDIPEPFGPRIGRIDYRWDGETLDAKEFSISRVKGLGVLTRYCEKAGPAFFDSGVKTLVSSGVGNHPALSRVFIRLGWEKIGDGPDWAVTKKQWKS